MSFFNKNKKEKVDKFKDLTQQPVQVVPELQSVQQPQLPPLQPIQENPHKELLIEIANHLSETTKYILSKLRELE